MGLRGPGKEFDVNMRISLTHSQNDFLRELSELHGVSKREVVRLMIDRAFMESMLVVVREGEK